MKQTNKFIEIVPDYARAYTRLYSEDYMAHPANSVINDFDIIEYVIFNPKRTISKSAIAQMEEHLDKKVRVVVIRNCIKYLIYLLKNRNGAVVFANDRILSSFIVGLICKKTVFMSHQSNLPEGILKRLIFQFFIKRFNLIKVSNPFEKEELIHRGIKKEKIKYIPLAIDYQYFSKKRKDLTKLKEKHKIKKDDKLILYLGNIRKFKNPYNLLKALKYANKNDNKIKLIIIGLDQLQLEGGLRINEFAKKLDISDNIIPLGALPPKQIVPFIQISNLGVIPSHHEGQCLVAYEFASAGLPLCLSNIGSFTSVFKNSALFCNPDDYKTLASNIIRYLNDPELVKKHAAINRRIVKERCDYDTIKSKLRELFVSLK